MSLEDRAMSFLDVTDNKTAKIPSEVRRQWALAQRQLVVNTLEVERMKYRVARTVGDDREMQIIRATVGALLSRLDEWDRIIAEIEAELEGDEQPTSEA